MLLGDALDSAFCQELVNDARVASGTRLVSVSGVDPERSLAHVLAVSDPGAAHRERGSRRVWAAERQWRAPVQANEYLRAALGEGRTVHAPLEEISRGVVPAEQVQAGKARYGLHYALMVPLIVDRQVVGALTYHLERPFSPAMAERCQAFSRQAARLIRLAQRERRLRERAQALAASSGAVLEAGEALRRRVAEFLHGPVQTRLLVALDRLGELRPLLATGREEHLARLDEALALLERVRAADLHGVSRALYPSVLSLGLLPALRSLAADFAALDVTVQADPAVTAWDDPIDNRLSHNLRLTLYRVAEEALDNAWRHGGAQKARVTVSGGDGHITIRIADDGCGLGGGPPRRGRGLAVLDARVAALGGEWGMEGGPDGGAVLWAAFPLPWANAAADGRVGCP